MMDIISITIHEVSRFHLCAYGDVRCVCTRALFFTSFRHISIKLMHKMIDKVLFLVIWWRWCYWFYLCCWFCWIDERFSPLAFNLQETMDMRDKVWDWSGVRKKRPTNVWSMPKTQHYLKHHRTLAYFGNYTEYSECSTAETKIMT